MNQSDLDNIAYNMFTNGDITLSEYLKYQNRDKIMTRQDELNEAWCKYRGKCSTEIIQALSFALRWCDEHPHWISVEDELPPLRQGVLAYNGVTIYIAWVSDDFVWRTHKEHCFRTYPVTHWIPLPQIPILSNSGNIGKDLKGGKE